MNTLLALHYKWSTNSVQTENWVGVIKDFVKSGFARNGQMPLDDKQLLLRLQLFGSQL